MPYVLVTTDDAEPRVLHRERVTPADFETEHFRRCLADRLRWAAEDAARPRRTARWEERRAEEPLAPVV